jgi:quercetin dioxygenase-like cupin family protein
VPRPELAEVEWIARTADVGVRINVLAPGQSTPWHFHSVVTDDVFCLDAGLAVELREPDESHALRPGERVRIAPRRVHRVANRSTEPMRYLLVQATGPYDFNEVP